MKPNSPRGQLWRHLVKTSYNQLAKSYFDAADEEKEELKITAEQKLPNNWSASWTQVYDLRNDTRDLTDSSFALNSAAVFRIV